MRNDGNIQEKLLKNTGPVLPISVQGGGIEPKAVCAGMQMQLENPKRKYGNNLKYIRLVTVTSRLLNSERIAQRLLLADKYIVFVVAKMYIVKIFLTKKKLSGGNVS